MISSLYERLRFAKSIPYVYYWLIFGLLIFIINTLLLYAFNENIIKWDQVLFSAIAITWVFIGWDSTCRLSRFS